MHHEDFMRVAIEEARLACKKGEVPVGAVAVADGKIVGRAHNIREATQNPFGHAEMILLENLAKERGQWRFDDVTIYVTLEPCIMCMGAMLQARIPHLVYGCPDPKAGACGSLYDLSNNSRLNHRIDVVRGVLEEECGELLSEFFDCLRND